MSDADHRNAAGKEGWEEASGTTWLARLVWLVGLVSTIYLVGWAGFLSFLSVAFIDYSGPGFAWWKVMGVVKDSTPLFCFLALGITGLRFWPRGRFRRWGLAAIVLQIAAAIWFLVSPDGLLLLTI